LVAGQSNGVSNVQMDGHSGASASRQRAVDAGKRPDRCTNATQLACLVKNAPAWSTADANATPRLVQALR